MKDESVDPRLRAALRHAPDRELLPPTSLDQHIRAAAHAALAPQLAAAALTGPQTSTQPWRRWLDRLLQPPAAAALATLSLSTVIVLMWHDQRPGPTAESHPMADTRSAQSAPEQAPTAAPASAVVQAPGPATATATAPVAAAAPAPEHAREATSAKPRAAAPALKSTSPVVAGDTAAPPPVRVATLPVERTPKRVEAEAVVSAALPPAPVAAALPALLPVPVPAAVPAPVSVPVPVPVPGSPRSAAAPQRSDAATYGAVGSLGALSRAATDASNPSVRAGAAVPASPSISPPAASLGAAVSPVPAPPPIAASGVTTSGPWQRVPSSQMPEGGQLIRDADGQALGRLLAQDGWLWWQPWVNGQPSLQAQRAPVRAAASAPAR